MAEETMKDFEKEIDASTRKAEVGDILTGTIIGISDGEVTVDLDSYAQGVIPDSELSDDPSFDPAKALRYGQKIDAAVIDLDDGHGNLLLSRKKANDNKAWETFQKDLEDGTVLTVKVREAVKGGVVAYVDGIRGFIPASQLSTHYVEDLNTYAGKDVDVRVITVDPKKKRLVLSGRSVEQDRRREERDHKIANLVPGTVVEGTVESIKPYGAFVSIGDGISGLVHISQISVKRVENVNSVLKEGQKVRCKILNTKDGKVSLSMKAVELDERPAREAATHKRESDAVSKFSDKGSVGTSLGDLLKGVKLS